MFDAYSRTERRFRALTQIAAHPDAERNAYRTSSHLRAFYNHVYEGIDNPPKMNPLAVLRWRMRTDEQAEAKAKWESQSKLSPAKPTAAWSGAMHSSPASMASGLGGSSESGRAGGSLGFSRPPGASPRKSQRAGLGASTASKGWRYTVEDVGAYKACDGVVNYFIPPRSAVRDDDASEQSERHQVQEEGSADGSSRQDNHEQVRVLPAADVSHADAPHATVDSPEESLAALSRTASVETGGRSGKGIPDNRVSRIHPFINVFPLTPAS